MWSFKQAKTAPCFALNTRQVAKVNLTKLFWGYSFLLTQIKKIYIRITFPRVFTLSVIGRLSARRSFLTRIRTRGRVGWTVTGRHDARAVMLKRGVMWWWGWLGGWWRGRSWWGVGGRSGSRREVWVIWCSPSWWRGWLGAPEGSDGWRTGSSERLSAGERTLASHRPPLPCHRAASRCRADVKEIQLKVRWVHGNRISIISFRRLEWVFSISCGWSAVFGVHTDAAGCLSSHKRTLGEGKRKYLLQFIIF